MINESFETNNINNNNQSAINTKAFKQQDIQPEVFSTKWSSSNINMKQNKMERLQTNQYRSSLNQQHELVNELNRPFTSISLPSKIKNEQEEEPIVQKLNKNHPSCPIINKSSSTLTPSEANIYDDYDNSFLISKTATNSNLDHFINLASNPFTTKFEFTASSKKKSLTIKSTSSNNIVNLDEEKKKRVNNFGLKFKTQQIKLSLESETKTYLFYFIFN